MEWVWSVGGGVRLFGALLVLAVSAVVFFARTGAPLNRSLALYLFADGLGEAARALNWLNMDPGLAPAFHAVALAAFAAVAVQSFRFFAQLPSPLTAPLRSNVGSHALLAALVASPVLGYVAYLSHAGVPQPGVDPVVAMGAASMALGVGLAVTFGGLGLIGLLVSISAYRHSPGGSIAKLRSRDLAVAFGIYSAWLALVNLVIRPFLGDFPLWRTVGELGGPLVVLPVFFALLGYGIVRHQLFDFDLRLKRSVRGGAVAAVVVAGYFVMSELAQYFLQDEVGPVLGIVAAGGLVLFIAPIQRWAERITDRAAPGVKPTAEYLFARKKIVYREAVETLLVDGTITDKERTLLARLGAQLELGPADAASVETEVRRSLGVGRTA